MQKNGIKALQLFPFFKDFDGVVVSGQEKTRKPFLDIYKLILNRYNIIPEKAIFIDDNKENIKSANALKINGIYYTKGLNLTEKLNYLFKIN